MLFYIHRWCCSFQHLHSVLRLFASQSLYAGFWLSSRVYDKCNHTYWQHDVCLLMKLKHVLKKVWNLGIKQNLILKHKEEYFTKSYLFYAIEAKISECKSNFAKNVVRTWFDYGMNVKNIKICDIKTSLI